MRRALAAILTAIALGGALSSCGGDSPEPEAAPEPPPPVATEPQPPTPEPQPPAPPAPLPPPSQPFTWQAAGAFVWHETDVSPEALGSELREAGFGWVALLLHDGLTEDPVEGDWVRRFREASGLPVGGWGVLREEPAREAALADALLGRHGLDFYVANAEAEYGYTAADGRSPERFGRSAAFAGAFRSMRPEFPAGLSSYCRPDLHDLDWGAWSARSFVFLPQAYVNDFGSRVAPAACALGAGAHFRTVSVHPTVGMHPGVRSSLGVSRYAHLLERAGTVGFSVYLAETRMTRDDWLALGQAAGSRGFARVLS